jgi:hypothetical protein
MAISSGISEVGPRRVKISANANPRRVAAAVAGAGTVQFDEPLPSRVHDALRSPLADNPRAELYVYGHYGQPIDTGLEFLDGYEFLTELSLNLDGPRALDGLARFVNLRRLTFQRATIPLRERQAPSRGPRATEPRLRRRRRRCSGRSGCQHRSVSEFPIIVDAVRKPVTLYRTCHGEDADAVRAAMRSNYEAGRRPHPAERRAIVMHMAVSMFEDGERL